MITLRPSHEAHETKKKFQDLMSEGNFDTPLFKIKQGARADDARTDLNVKNDPSYLDEYVTCMQQF